MAVLSTEERRRTLAHMMRQALGTISITKPQLRAAVDTIDDFLEAQASTINQAFPVAARTGLTTAQKAAVVSYVAARRAGLLQAQEDL
jgi:hypothetical protein